MMQRKSRKRVLPFNNVIEMKTPVIVINMKVYDRSLGVDVMKLLTVCEHVVKETGASIALAPPMVELSKFSSTTDLPIFSQHADAFGLGARTGSVPIEAVKLTGCTGLLLNHSERRLGIAEIGDSKLIVLHVRTTRRRGRSRKTVNGT